MRSYPIFLVTYFTLFLNSLTVVCCVLALSEFFISFICKNSFVEKVAVFLFEHVADSKWTYLVKFGYIILDIVQRYSGVLRKKT
jgi:hypothetical protein